MVAKRLYMPGQTVSLGAPLAMLHADGESDSVWEAVCPLATRLTRGCSERLRRR